MKPRHLLALAVLFATGCFASAATPSASEEKVQALPLTIYPRFEVRDAGFVPTFNRFARPEDALVVASTDALKLNFRVASLGVSRGQVWIYEGQDISLGQTHRENIAGARGLVFIPSHLPSTPTLRGLATQVADQAKSLGLPLIVGLDERDLRTLSNVADLVRSADIFTICASSRLHDSPADYRAAVAKIIAAAREVNPRIRIELGFVAPMDAAFCAHQIELAVATADLADRLAIFCEASAESRASLDKMIARFRPEPRGGGQAQD